MLWHLLTVESHRPTSRQRDKKTQDNRSCAQRWPGGCSVLGNHGGVEAARGHVGSADPRWPLDRTPWKPFTAMGHKVWDFGAIYKTGRGGLGSLAWAWWGIGIHELHGKGARVLERPSAARGPRDLGRKGQVRVGRIRVEQSRGPKGTSCETLLRVQVHKVPKVQWWQYRLTGRNGFIISSSFRSSRSISAPTVPMLEKV